MGMSEAEMLMASIFFNTIVETVARVKEHCKENGVSDDSVSNMLEAFRIHVSVRWPPKDSGVEEVGSFYDRIDITKTLVYKPKNK